MSADRLEVIPTTTTPRIAVGVEGFHVRAMITLSENGPPIDVTLPPLDAAALSDALHVAAVRAANALAADLKLRREQKGDDDARRR